MLADIYLFGVWIGMKNKGNKTEMSTKYMDKMQSPQKTETYEKKSGIRFQVILVIIILK